MLAPGGEERPTDYYRDGGDDGQEGRDVFVAAGHGAWGISLSLGTGWCVAGMVDGKDMSEYVGRLGL